MEDIRFGEESLKVSRNSHGGIDKVCINDICRALKRASFLNDGTAVRRCPSAAIVDEDSPKVLYADFDEAVALVKWIAAGSKVLGPTGHRLLELLQSARAGTLRQAAGAGDRSWSEPEELIVMEYSGNRFTMKMSDGRYMVNATEMARPFGKRPTVWLKLAETVKLRQALVDDGICRDMEGQVVTTRGPHGATWLEIHLWTQFAQWLSPAFASFCSKKLVSLMKGATVEPSESAPHAAPRARFGDIPASDDSLLPVPASYEEALTVIDRQRETIHRHKEFLKLNRHKVEHYDETVEACEWFSTTMIANELGVSAIRLNQFLADEGVQDRRCGEWAVTPRFRHLRDAHIYEWFNHKTKYTNKYKIDGWTPADREYILELWKKNNA
ncbi:MAG: phage antirepressor KilAC domain-containing protein [Alistipes sp.]|jgi:phage antirepressor YoqD-like protein|nr:phage antirepressor KilAC domain-containing protein [Alistipes sp.]